MKNKITIECIHICESVIQAKNGNLSIINIFNQINADSFPFVHPILFVVIDATGFEGEYEVNIQIKKPGEDPILTQVLSDKIKISKSPMHGRLLVKFSPLVIRTAGDYEIIVSILEQTKKVFLKVVGK